MTMSKARCPERKREEDERQPPPHPPLPEASTGGRAPDGYHLWRPGCSRGCRNAGTTWPGRHIEFGASDPEAAISAHDLIARWALSRSLKNRKSL